MIDIELGADFQTTARQAAKLRTMRLVAGGLLVLMGLTYLLAVTRLDHGVGWGYVRAFAEAAMVGGLADWFAVTALFRRPLNLPIPHTAIIPRSKERIAEALGQFVAVNFLAPDVIATRLQHQDLASALGRQLADAAAARRIADGLVDALPGIADLLDDDVVSDFALRQLTELSRDGRLSAAIGRGLKLLTEHGRHQPLLDALIAEAWRVLEEHEPAIRAQVRARTSWAYRLIALDARASDAMISAVEETLRDMAADADHPARDRITQMLQRFSDELENSSEMRAKIERLITDILAHPAVVEYFAELWTSLKAAMHQSASTPKAQTRLALAEGIQRFGRALIEDPAVVIAINRRLRSLFAEIAGRHGRDLGRLISETIRSWDTATVVEKLEHNVGPDLQYIRINGTLIGGLIGLCIHQLTIWLT